MDGFEYLYPDYSPPQLRGGSTEPAEVTNAHLLMIGCFFLLSLSPLLIFSRRCRRRAPEPLLPVTDSMVHSMPSAQNPYLKLRIHSYSAAEETITSKPILHI